MDVGGTEERYAYTISGIQGPEAATGRTEGAWGVGALEDLSSPFSAQAPTYNQPVGASEHLSLLFAHGTPHKIDTLSGLL
jgi:hypothetical protein